MESAGTTTANHVISQSTDKSETTSGRNEPINLARITKRSSQKIVSTDESNKVSCLRIITDRDAPRRGQAHRSKATDSSAAPLHTILCNNEWLTEVLDDWETPVEERLTELRKQRKVLIRANLPTKDITIAIHHLDRLAAPLKLVLDQAPYQLFVTINCHRNYPDPIVINKLNKLLIRVNDKLNTKRWRKRNIGFDVYGVLEKQTKLLGEKTSVDRGVIDTDPHWHLMVKPAVAGELLDPVRYMQVFQEILIESDINQIDTTLCDEFGLVLRDENNEIMTDQVFDPTDIDVQKMSSDLDNRRVAGYITKNLFRGCNTHDQWGVGLYHFNRDGLVKVH